MADSAHAAGGGTDGRAEGVAPTVSVFIGLGANLGDRKSTLRAALAAIGQLHGTRLLRISPLYGSAPVDAGGPDYLNAVAELATTQAPQALLQALQAIERSAGRERPYRNAPRTLDLDVLIYGDQRLESAELTIPHPRMHQRAFVLHPLSEIAPERVGPGWLAAVQGQRIEQLPGTWWSSPADGCGC